MALENFDFELDLTQLRLLAALGESCNVSAAASRIGLSQSAASHALAKLRKRFGDPLFVRTSGGLRPTPYAERLINASQQAMRAIQTGVEGPHPFDPATSRRTFTAYMSDVGQAVLLPRLVQAMRDEAPHANLNVLPFPAFNQEAALEAGEVDVALGYLPSLSAGFRQRLLYKEQYVCVAREDHPAFRNGMTLEGFRSTPHAVTSASSTGHKLLGQVLAREKIRRRAVLALPQFMVLPMVATHSDLLAIVPSRLAEIFAPLGRLKIMPPPVRMPEYDVRIFWHDRYHLDPGNKWLRDLFVRLYQVRRGSE
ncbi:LysR family transcriptional regulator [Pigmentiphaga soli]|uniref:LysR family transcriptional regulator n=1 Tax=Pigmentiphaga soli TaxID=1007095 RepID=A0ABP8GZV8_9BURK